MTELGDLRLQRLFKENLFPLIFFQRKPLKNVFFLVKDSLPDFGLRTIKGPHVPKCPL